MASKLYLVVRADLSPAQQAVQAAHAAREFQAKHPEVERAWFEGSNHLALLSVPGEDGLRELVRRAGDVGLRTASFREPDRGDEMTAIALEPAAKRLVRSLPLALK
jgi:peptidyl-tRNA hydrolase